MSLSLNSWVDTYKTFTNNWVADSLSKEQTDLIFLNGYSPLTSFFNSSFINQHFLLDNLTKLSYLDTILINSNLNYSAITQTLFIALNEDLLLQSSIFFLPLTALLNSEYQDTLTIIFLLSPELSYAIIDYIYLYVNPSVFTYTTSAVFDSYISNWFYTSSSGSLFLLLYWIYAWVIVYSLLTYSILKWPLGVSPQFTRFYYYFYSLSREIRIQLESVFQTIVFFLIYWITTLMTFDDNQEEVIEFVDTSFFYFFVFITLYICYKYSIHYFAFLEASVVTGRSVGFLVKQVFKDFLNTLSLFLRFYILLLRVNVYDTLDDFLDSYYIFVGDFDEDEYLNELFLSVYGAVLFALENDYDTSYLFEDEHDFFSDFFYVYSITWGKFFYFSFFMLEEAARLSLAFYVCYLIIFEVHNVNCSYKEDIFLLRKRLNV